jgi:hypothetical protein
MSSVGALDKVAVYAVIMPIIHSISEAEILRWHYQ